MTGYRPIERPLGTKISCKGWLQEAAMRMLMHNVSEDVAEKPAELIVYGGTGKAARNWDAFHRIVATLKELKNDETLLVQSGKPVGVFRTTADSPRVLIANSLLVPRWATWEKFRELERLGLTMYGQMTAGSWIYIGTQGILQGTYETFVEAIRQHFGGDMSGKTVFSAGLGGMGGAQPLAATMAGASFLGVEVDRERIERRVRTGYVDVVAEDLDDALRIIDELRQRKEARSVALLGNAADVYPELVRRGIFFEMVTDQTSAHDMLNGYVPAGIGYEEALALRGTDPEKYQKLAFESVAKHVRAMLDMKENGSVVFDYGNNIRGQAELAGVEDAFEFPGFVPAYIRPLFCIGKGPFRWVALSGDPEDIYQTDELVLRLFPDDEPLVRWIRAAREKVRFQGYPSRICWLGYGERAKFGLAINDLVRQGKIKAPIVIGRDHLDSGSVASPFRETESMKDGSDAIADWPILNALLNAISGASWVSVHHGGGVGIGLSIHAGMVIVADGTDAAAARLERVLTCDPGSGIARHVDAGYDLAIETARAKGVKIPGLQ